METGVEDAVEDVNVLAVVVEGERTEVVCDGDCRELVNAAKTSVTCKKLQTS